MDSDQLTKDERLEAARKRFAEKQKNLHKLSSSFLLQTKQCVPTLSASKVPLQETRQLTAEDLFGASDNAPFYHVPLIDKQTTSVAAEKSLAQAPISFASLPADNAPTGLPDNARSAVPNVGDNQDFLASLDDAESPYSVLTGEQDNDAEKKADPKVSDQDNLEKPRQMLRAENILDFSLASMDEIDLDDNVDLNDDEEENLVIPSQLLAGDASHSVDLPETDDHKQKESLHEGEEDDALWNSKTHYIFERDPTVPQNTGNTGPSPLQEFPTKDAKEVISNESANDESLNSYTERAPHTGEWTKELFDDIPEATFATQIPEPPLDASNFQISTDGNFQPVVYDDDPCTATKEAVRVESHDDIRISFDDSQLLANLAEEGVPVNIDSTEREVVAPITLIDERLEKMEEHKISIKELLAKISEMDHKVKQQEETIRDQENLLKEQRSVLERQEISLNHHKLLMDENTAIIDQQKLIIESQKMTIEEQNVIMEGQKVSINEQNETIDTQKLIIDEQKGEIARLGDSIGNDDSEDIKNATIIGDLQATIERMKKENTNLKLGRMDLNDRIAELEEELQEVKSSCGHDEMNSERSTKGNENRSIQPVPAELMGMQPYEPSNITPSSPGTAIVLSEPEIALPFNLSDNEGENQEVAAPSVVESTTKKDVAQTTVESLFGAGASDLNIPVKENSILSPTDELEDVTVSGNQTSVMNNHASGVPTSNLGSDVTFKHENIPIQPASTVVADPATADLATTDKSVEEPALEPKPKETSAHVSNNSTDPLDEFESMLRSVVQSNQSSVPTDLFETKSPLTSTSETAGNKYAETPKALPVLDSGSDFRERLMVWKGWQVDMTSWTSSNIPKVAL